MSEPGAKRGTDPDIDRRAILARRRRFIALALGGLAPLVGACRPAESAVELPRCDEAVPADPEPVAIVETPPGETTEAEAPTESCTGPESDPSRCAGQREFTAVVDIRPTPCLDTMPTARSEAEPDPATRTKRCRE